MSFLWFGRTKKEQTYESLREALYATDTHPVRSGIGVAMLAMGYLGGNARFTRQNDRMGIVCHIIIGVSNEIKISDPYKEIRREDTSFNFKAEINFKHPKKIHLEKAVGYVAGAVTVAEMQPLIDCLTRKYFLQEMVAVAPKTSEPPISQSRELEELDRQIAGYPNFEPL